MPELVSWEQDGVFVLLVEAVKAQPKQIEALQMVRTENVELKKRLDELTALVQRLFDKPAVSK